MLHIVTLGILRPKYKPIVRLPSWVCALCSQHFTRKYSAKKHNFELHADTGTIVRFMDYIIGRIDGKFLPDDPSRYYRRRSKWSSQVGAGPQIANPRQDKTIADSTHGRAFSMPSDIYEKPLDNSAFHTTNDGPTNKLTVQSRINYKLKLYKSILNECYPDDAEGLLSVMFNLISQGDGEDFLDQQISILRQVYLNRTRNDAVPMNSFVNYKIPPADQKFHNEGLLTQLLRFQPSAADKDREAEMLLLEINDILLRMYPPQYVARLVVALKNEYSRTQDIVTLRMARDNHRDIALRKGKLT
jgi:hypothetical protein